MTFLLTFVTFFSIILFITYAICHFLLHALAQRGRIIIIGQASVKTPRVIPMAKPIIDASCFDAVARVLSSGALAQGNVTQSFEREFASYIGVKNAVSVNSGTSALHTALLAAGVDAGDEVITTSFSFAATANSILHCGARPVFADICSDTLNIDPSDIEKRITPKTKAIIIVHLYGHPCDMDSILRICNKYGITLIEDACQAHGAEYRGKKVGSFGIGCFSFYPTKNMTTGEGGMITLNDDATTQKAEKIRNHGQSSRYCHEILGYNYRMTDICAAIGRNQLKMLDIMNGCRIKNARFLSKTVNQIDMLTAPLTYNSCKHVFHQYTVRLKDDAQISRENVQKFLLEKGVSSAVHYSVPIHKQPLYLKLGYSETLPNAEKAAKQVLSLPIHPSLTADELERISKAIRGAF